MTTVADTGGPVADASGSSVGRAIVGVGLLRVRELLAHPGVPCALVVTLLLASIAGYSERMFGVASIARIGIAICLYVSVGLILLALTQRLGAATYVAFAFVVGLGILSKLKFDYSGATLHALDLYLHLATPTEVAYFIQHEPRMVLAAVGLLLSVVGLGVWIGNRDVVWRVPRVVVLPLAALPLLPAVHYAASPRLQEQMQHAHFYDGYHLTSWFLSLFLPIDGVALARRFPGTPPPERVSVPVTALPPATAVAVDAAAPPNIIVILHESTIDPRRFRPAEVVRFKDDPFVSSDGATRRLIVETFGGRTWITEYGLMFGLSTHYFQPNQSFLGYLLEGKIRNSLAHTLGQKGYGSTYVYPAPRRFANTGRFYRSLGFERILDLNDQKQPAYNKRDREHYATALADLTSRRAAGDRRPQFTFVMTEATHFPWATPYFPETRADEIDAGDEWAEFSRRIRIGHDDYSAFKAELAARFPNERFLLVGFGDHHPWLTGAEIADTDPATSARFDTFYRLDGVNFTPDFKTAPDGIEIGYLGTVIQTAARLPLDTSYAQRLATLKACRGLMHRCKDQREMEALHRALVERGDIVPRYALSR